MTNMYCPPAEGNFSNEHGNSDISHSMRL